MNLKKKNNNNINKKWACFRTCFSDHQHEESWGRIRSESNQVNSLDRREMYETSSLRKAYSQCSLVCIYIGTILI